METTETEPVLAKTSFDGIYDRADPRSYYRSLGAYDYAVSDIPRDDGPGR